MFVTEVVDGSLSNARNKACNLNDWISHLLVNRETVRPRPEKNDMIYSEKTNRNAKGGGGGEYFGIINSGR